MVSNSDTDDTEATGSWLERAHANGVVSPGARAESDAGLASVTSSIGWDPYQVWLHYIDRPRRQRNAVRREIQSSSRYRGSGFG